jgi:hypothetical protein
MPARTRFAAAAVAAASVCVLAAVAPAAHASDPATPATASPPLALTFVPPKVGPLRVDIGPTVINGKIIDPGLHVHTAGVSLPTIHWTLPPMTGTLPPLTRPPAG